MNRPLSSKVKSAVGAALLGVFGAAPFILPGYEILRERRWNATPCLILSSSVLQYDGRNGPLYRIDINYMYVVAGRKHAGIRYRALGDSSISYGAKREIVRRYPPGAETVCYVNPADPAEAVIERRFTPDIQAASESLDGASLSRRLSPKSTREIPPLRSDDTASAQAAAQYQKPGPPSAGQRIAVACSEPDGLNMKA